jgi:hypothetical protein
VDCGAGAAGSNVPIGAPLAVACGPGTGDLSVAPATPGTYTFSFKRIDGSSGELVVTGP